MARFSLLVLVVTCSVWADAKFFANPFKDISEFLGLSLTDSRVYLGTDKKNRSCEIKITRSPSELVITPVGLSPEDKFRVPALSADDVNGGTEDNHLWSSYFIDDEGSLLHGQFGVSYRIDLKTDGRDGLLEFSYYRSRIQDLGYELMGKKECLNLKPQP